MALRPRIPVLGGIAIVLMMAARAPAQVPPDTLVRFSFGSASEGIQLFDRVTGAYTTVTNVPASVSADLNCGTIDPANGDLLVGGSGGEIVRLRLSGATVVSSTVISTGLLSGANALALDNNGNLFVAQGQEIHQFDRTTNTATLWDSFSYGGNDFNCMTIDTATNRMWVGTSGGTGAGIVEWDLDAGPGAGVQIVNFDVLDIVTASTSGIAFDGDHTLYLTNFFEALFQFDLSAGVESLIPNPPAGFIMNACWVDKQSGQVVSVDNGGGFNPPDTVYETAPTGGTVTYAGLEDGVPSGVAINDFRDITTVHPATAVVSANFLLELATHGNPGELAAIFITEINGIPMSLLLGIGTLDAGGLFKLQIPIAAGSITPNHTVKYQGARRSSGVIFGSVATQILVP